MAMPPPSWQTQQFSSKVREAIEAGEKFVEVFYDTVDKRRQVRTSPKNWQVEISPPKLQVLPGLYSNASLVIWNGNTHSGASNILDFYQSLPGTMHIVVSMDCQPVLATPSPTVLISCKGTVRFDSEASEKRFSQDFLLNKEGDVWKVGSDCFRFIDRL